MGIGFFFTYLKRTHFLCRSSLHHSSFVHRECLNCIQKLSGCHHVFLNVNLVHAFRTSFFTITSYTLPVHCFHHFLKQKFLNLGFIIAKGCDDRTPVSLFWFRSAVLYSNIFDYLLFTVDVFTKFVMLEPLSTATTKQAIRGLR